MVIAQAIHDKERRGVGLMDVLLGSSPAISYGWAGRFIQRTVLLPLFVRHSPPVGGFSPLFVGTERREGNAG